MRSFLTALLIVCSVTVFAQSNYHEGYVIKLNGDTLKGYIDYREWSLSPTSIDFKSNKDDKVSQQFDPTNTKKFEIQGLENYSSYTGLISVDRNRFPDLPDNLDTTKAQASIFIKELVTGHFLSLYSAIDGRKVRYFIKENDGNVEELKYYQYYNDRHEAIERAVFKGQLIILARKYRPENTNLAEQASATMFEADPLAKIVSAINGEQNIDRSAHSKNLARFFVGAGAFIDQTHFTNPNFQQLGDYGSHFYKITAGCVSTVPQLDFGVDLFINPNVQKLFFRAEISFTVMSPKISFPLSGILDSEPIDILTLDQFTTSFYPQLVFNLYNSDKIKLYLDAGASLNFSSYANKKFTQASTGQIDQGEQFYDFNSFWLSLPVGVGVTINKKIDIGVFYYPESKFTSDATFTFSNQAFNFGVKYLFGSK